MTALSLGALLVALAAGCADTPRDSSEAAWRRGQCGYIIDAKQREKCLEQVDREYGRW